MPYVKPRDWSECPHCGGRNTAPLATRTSTDECHNCGKTYIQANKPVEAYLAGLRLDDGQEIECVKIYFPQWKEWLFVSFARQTFSVWEHQLAQTNYTEVVYPPDETTHFPRATPTPPKGTPT